MNKSGFFRKTILIALVTWAFAHFLLADGLLVRSSHLRGLTTWILAAIAVWGVITLLQQRMKK
jgi:hypothetical protein